MHDSNIVHMDIKIDNNMCRNETHDTVYKLGDFGLAKQYPPGTVPKEYDVRGTTNYLPQRWLSLQSVQKEWKPNLLISTVWD